MKIIPSDNSFLVDSQSTNLRNKTEPNSIFKDVLNESMKKSAPEKVSESQPLTSSSSVQKLYQPSVLPFDRPQILNRKQLVDKMDGFLNLLEDYAAKLDDSTVDMHEIHPLIDKIKQENQVLISQFSHLDEQDHLAHILDGILKATEIEITNFENGNYVGIP